MKKKGFTLIELIPVILILSLAMMCVGIVVNYGLDTNKRQTIQNEVQENIRKAIVDFTDNVRKGSGFILYNGKTNAQLTQDFVAMSINYASGQEVFDITETEGYQGILFIRQINAQYCLYAIKDNSIHRFSFTPSYPADIFQDKTGLDTSSTIDKNTRLYYYDNYRFPKGIDSDSGSQFNFYQGSRYFHCSAITASGTSTINELEKKPIELIGQEDNIIADDIETVHIAAANNAYKFGFTISKKNILNDMLTERKIETSIALVNYGGDGDEE